MSNVDPSSQMPSRMGEAEAWLRRARLEWRRGERARTVLTLSLAEAELRVARQEAMSAPQPDRRSSAVPRAALAAACTALSAILAAGAWLGVRWTEQEPVARGPAARGTETRLVTLPYVPGDVLRLVAPSPERAPAAAPRPVEVALVTGREVPPARSTVLDQWPLPSEWWGAELLRRH